MVAAEDDHRRLRSRGGQRRPRAIRAGVVPRLAVQSSGLRLARSRRASSRTGPVACLRDRAPLRWARAIGHAAQRVSCVSIADARTRDPRDNAVDVRVLTRTATVSIFSVFFMRLAHVGALSVRCPVSQKQDVLRNDPKAARINSIVFSNPSIPTRSGDPFLFAPQHAIATGRVHGRAQASMPRAVCGQLCQGA